MGWLDLIHKLCNKRVKKKEIENSKSQAKKISEPVISFLKVFESNPRRFKIRSIPTLGHDACAGYSNYKMVDTKTDETFTFLKRWFYNEEEGLYGVKILSDFLTLDEKKLVVKTIWEYYSGRKSKLEYLKGIRKGCSTSKERKRLTKIYQEDL